MGILALAGGGGSSSSSSSNNATKTVKPTNPKEITKCEIKGNNPIYLKRSYTLSYDCDLISADYGKTLTIDYDNTIVELSKSSFTLPKNKDASESFTIKTKENQGFKLTPKIESQAFTVRNITATKDISIPKEAQFTIEEFTPTLTGGTFPNQLIYSLNYFKGKFYLFPRRSTNYYSSSDGKTWKDEGKPNNEWTSTVTLPSPTVIFQDQLWLFRNTKGIYSAANPNGTNFQKKNITGIRTAYQNNNFVVFDNALWFHDTDTFHKSINGLAWSEILNTTDKTKQIDKAPILSYERKIWTFGGFDEDDNISSLVLSFDGTTLEQESNLPKALQYATAQVFAEGMVVIGGIVDEIETASNDLYWSTYGKTWTKVLTDAKIGSYIRNGSVLKSKNEMWIVKQTAGVAKVYKITFDPTK